MAVGRGSMERAAKAAGTDASVRKSEDRTQTPYRRLTISEIVGETSIMDIPPSPRRTTSVRTSGVSKAAADKPEVKSEPLAVKEAIVKSEPMVVEEPAVKSEPVMAEALEVKNEPVATEEPEVKNEPLTAEEPAVESETVAAEEAADTSTAAGAETDKEVSDAPAAESMTPEAKAEEVSGESSAPEDETEGQIVYQKSSGMLERAAKPNERFGLGDAMPVYYF